MGSRTGSSRGRRWWLIATPVVMAALVGALLSGSWHESVMTARVVVTTDGEEPALLYEARVPFSSYGRVRPVVTAEIDLARWQGKLLRLDVQGEVKPRSLVPGRSGYLGCSAELVSGAEVRPVDFVGWEEPDRYSSRTQAIGSPSYDMRGNGEARFLYAKEDGLWCVLRAPAAARLRLSLKPMLARDVRGASKLFVPDGRGRLAAAKTPLGSNPGRAPDVFIYLIDALRADHLGCYGYHRGTSPQIDAFAQGATVYEQAQTVATWTRPSVASILTGLYPRVHGAVHLADKLDGTMTLLPEIAREAGYKTCFITANSVVSKAFGFDRGCDEFVCENQQSADWVNEQVRGFLARQDASQPVFMYLHTVEPHAPYRPRAESLRRFDRGFKGACDGSLEAMAAAPRVRPRLSHEDIEHLIDLYDGEVFDVDRAFGEFLELLKRTGRLDDALIILTADHGECFAEHGTLDHGWTLNQEEMRVPLLMRFPRGRAAGVRVGTGVSLMDLFPTLLAQMGASAHLTEATPGLDLGRAAAGSEPLPSRPLFAEVSKVDTDELHLVGVIDEDGYKRVVDLSVGPGTPPECIGLWDTREDAGEEDDLTARLPVRASYGEQLAAGWIASQERWRELISSSPAAPVVMTEEMRRQLRDMGYLK